MHNLKNTLIKPQKLNFYPEDKIADSGLIAICIIFIQNLISVEKPDIYQNAAVIAFTIAVPILAIHFFAIQSVIKSALTFPTWFAKIFENISYIGFVSTQIGIFFVLLNTYCIAAIIFFVSGTIALGAFSFIKGYTSGYN